MRPFSLLPVALLLALSAAAQEPGPQGRGPRAGGPNRGSSEGIRLHVPSDACASEGVAVILTLPRTPRWAEGAPVVVHIPGGWGQSGLEQRGADLSGFGFADLRFSFPGGGLPDFQSGGANDHRGEPSIRALRDLIRFATGRKADSNGKTIQDHAGKIKILVDHAGLAGWSNGGNPAGIVAALYGKDFPDLAFYASFESPLGEGACGAELGGFGTGPNPAYDPDTGVLDLKKLAWDPELRIAAPGGGRGGAGGREGGAGGRTSGAPARPGGGDPGRASLPSGGLFFDLDGDGSFDEGSDFAGRPLAGTSESGEPRAGYSLRLLRGAEESGLFAEGRPSQIPSLAEAEVWWQFRDALPHLPRAVENCPKLAVIVYGSEKDHVQAALDHPHILAQVEGYRAAGATFVRLNPDRAYVQWVSGGGAETAVDNPAGQAWDHRSIRAAMEPEDAASDAGYMAAALCELADRTHAKDWRPNLDAPLHPDAPRSDLPPPRPQRGGR